MIREPAIQRRRASVTPRWTPNPYAVAEQIIGQALSSDWTVAQDQLLNAFRLKSVDSLFYSVDGKPALMQLFTGIARSVTSPQPLAALERLPAVKKAIALYGEEVVERVLLFLVPVAESVFAPIGAKPPPDKRYAGSYQIIGSYLQRGARFIDPVQGAASDCYLIAAMSALAWTYPEQWAATVASAHRNARADANCSFAFFKTVKDRYAALSVTPAVPASLPLTDDVAVKLGVNTGPRLYYARSSDFKESWPGVMEKAYLMQFGHVSTPDPTPKDYLLLDNSSYPHIACQRLMGGRRRAVACGGATEGNPTATRVVHRLCDAKRGVTDVPVMAWTWETRVPAMGKLTWKASGLIPNHVYTVLGVIERDGKAYVALRNPHGRSAMRADDYLRGEWKPGRGSGGEAKVLLNDSGVFAIRSDWFDLAFGTVGFVTQDA